MASENSSNSGKLDDLIILLRALANNYSDHNRTFGTTLTQLDMDYHVLYDEPIPYKAYGYGTLYELLKSLPDDFRLFNNLHGAPVVVSLEYSLRSFFPKFMYPVNSYNTVRISIFQYGDKIPSILTVRKFMVGIKFPLEVCEVYSPNRFWFRMLRYESRLLLLEQQMCNFYSYTRRKSSTIPEHQIVVGLFVAVAYNNTIYRAEIFYVDLDKDIVKVQLIDYGSHLVVKPNCIKCLPKMFGELPRLAMRGSLTGLFPITGEWQNELLNSFTEIVRKETFWAKATEIDHLNRIFYLMLLNNTVKPPLLINQLMCEKQDYPTPKQKLIIDEIWEKCNNDLSQFDPTFLDLEKGLKTHSRITLAEENCSLFDKHLLRATALNTRNAPNKFTKEQQLELLQRPLKRLQEYRMLRKKSTGGFC